MAAGPWNVEPSGFPFGSRHHYALQRIA